MELPVDTDTYQCRHLVTDGASDSVVICHCAVLFVSPTHFLRRLSTDILQIFPHDVALAPKEKKNEGKSIYIAPFIYHVYLKALSNFL